MSLSGKLERLKRRLKASGSALVAYSGGVDSSFLLKIAKEVLGNKVLAVTASSDIHPLKELECARRFAKKLKVKHEIIRTHELKDPRFLKNPEDRCYFCKKGLLLGLKKIASRHKINAVMDGSNIDDLSDHRPGAKAKREAGIVSPLEEARLTKKEVRELSRRFKLSTWDKPALACLASRIPYYSRITRKRLKRIEKAEEVLRRSFCIKGNLRVRDFGDCARIEVDKNEIKRLAISERVKILMEGLGYKNVVVDLKGYRPGRLNEEVSKK